MIKRYRRFRSYGHGVVASTILAPTFWHITVVSVVVGLIIGVWL